MSMIPVVKPAIGREEEEAVLAVLRSGQIAQGARVAEFEQRFAELIGTRYAVATSSGTASLHLNLLALGIGPGDEVITSSPGPMPRASRLRCNDAVPDEVATAYLVPINSANRCSNSATRAPWAI